MADVSVPDSVLRQLEAIAADATGDVNAQAATAPTQVQDLKDASKAIPGLSQIGTFFNALGEANTWIRVGEAVLGLILIAVGVARLTHAQNFISAAVKAVPV